MKRTLALLLALVMLLGMLPMSAFADTPADTPTITFTHNADPSTLKVGDEFTVTATLANNPGIGAFQLDLNWDNNVVEFLGYNTVKLYGMTLLESDVMGGATLNQKEGTIVIGTEENLSENGKLFVAKFKVKKEGDPAITHDADFFQLKKIIMNDDGTSSGQFETYTVTFDMNALENLIISHVHDYTSVVTPPTCTEDGYTTYTCACGYSYTSDITPATGHTPSETEAGKCGKCGAAMTIIPDGAPFLDMMTSDGKPVTITDLGPDPKNYMGTLYKVEVPMGTTQVDVTYKQGDVYVDNFGYAKTYVFTDDYTPIEDGYKAEIKDGKTRVGLEMVKSAANGISGTIYLLNTPYPADPYELVYAGLGKQDFSNLHFFAFTYKMEEGQYGVSLPKSFMYTVTGDPVATGSYTFNVAMKNGYEASETFAVKVNDEVVATEPGEITVDSVTEELIITVEGVKKIYNPETDISITVDLTEYTGAVDGFLSYSDKANNTYQSNLIPGKRNTVVMEASKVWHLYAYINSIGSDVVGYDINGEIRAPGYLSFGFNVRDNAQPGAYVIKPIVEKVEEKEPNPITNIEISHPNIKTETNPETGATSMTMAMVTGASETIDLSFTVQNADQESTQEIAWSSSDPEVAAVENGKVTALKAGSTVITAKAVDTSGVAAAAEGEEVLAQFTLTVSDPAAGYTVTMGEVKPVDAGETISIPVTVNHTNNEDEATDNDVQNYKSYEFVFQYDTDLLTLVTGSSEDEAQEFTVVDESGTVTLRRYGNEKNVGEAAVTLEFTAKKTGESDVKLTSAKVGTSADAQDQNIPDAAIIDNLTKITVTGYDVDLDDAFTGAGVADPEKDYTFEAKDKNYVYTVTVTVGDKTFDIRDEDKDGSLTIPKDKITGNMKIDVESAVGKTFNVEIIGNGAAAVTDEGEAQYMTDYVLTAAEGVDLTGYTIKYKIGDGEEKTMSNYTIPGNEITGNITITVTAPGTDPEDPDRPANSWKITFEGNGKDDVQANSNYVTKGQPYTFQINKTEGYTYIVTYMGENGVEELTAAKDGTYTITPTADMTIKVMKWNVEVNQYVALNGKTVFLVSVAGEADIGMQYDGKTMFVKSVNALGEGGKYTGEAADKYVYLVELAEGTLNVEDAARKLSIVENVTCENIEKTFNVNGSSNLDINDAQLVYDMYNNVYQSIATENIGMLKFLKADVNCDRTIGVQDAAAVVNEILK